MDVTEREMLWDGYPSEKNDVLELLGHTPMVCRLLSKWKTEHQLKK
jgi:hypothetical protein